jgi:hypothetical protein
MVVPEAVNQRFAPPPHTTIQSIVFERKESNEKLRRDKALN